MSNLVRTTRFWNNIHQVRSRSQDWKTPNKSLSILSTMDQQDKQDRVRLPVPEGD